MLLFFCLNIIVIILSIVHSLILGCTELNTIWPDIAHAVGNEKIGQSAMVISHMTVQSVAGNLMYTNGSNVTNGSLGEIMLTLIFPWMLVPF